MLEVYVLVPVRKSFAKVFAGVLMFVLAVISVFLCCATTFAIPFVFVFGALGYFFLFQSSKEFEYSYFDGEARFARVMNKSRRKSLGSYSMDDVAQIAPSGDRSVYNYENNSGMKVTDYTSHDKERADACYVMVLPKQNMLIRFEPDEKYLEAVEHKYKQKVIRRNNKQI